jgi:CheY-like chemotaxis protein/two-component sensor histidine kinase
LAPIINAVSIMRLKVNGDPELSWCRDMIERQARQLTRLVDDLLDVARITRGTMTLQPEHVDVAAVVANAVEASRPLIDERGHELTVLLPDPPVVLRGDPARLTQIVSNLLNNAAKYQDHGGRIEVTVAHDGANVVLAVADRGIGIPPEALPSVFDLFSRVGRSTDRVDDGLGIGLALVKKFTELHGGTIEATSDGARKGSRFVVRLPRLKETDDSSLPPVEAAPSEFGGPPLRILVADDNRDAALSLATLLTMSGHRVTLAHDGVRALELARAEKPDVLLLDIGLPGMDGYEVCRSIRESGLSDMRVLAVSGFGQAADRQRSKAAGFDGHFVKPVDHEQLMRLLHDREIRRGS